jgi:hypothetical protein
MSEFFCPVSYDQCSVTPGCTSNPICRPSIRTEYRFDAESPAPIPLRGPITVNALHLGIRKVNEDTNVKYDDTTILIDNTVTDCSDDIKITIPFFPHSLEGKLFIFKALKTKGRTVYVTALNGLIEGKCLVVLKGKKPLRLQHCDGDWHKI